MPSSDLAHLADILDKNGPIALVAMVFAAMWWFERKEVKMLQGKVIKMSAVILSRRNRDRDDDD